MKNTSGSPRFLGPDRFLGQDLASLVDSSWLKVLAAQATALGQVSARLNQDLAAGHGFLPPTEDVFRALRQPVRAVRVIILGQDPYPTPGHAHGLAFSTQPNVHPLPRSLRNIFTELEADADVPSPDHGNLSAWEDQGVLLLNPVLTVRAGAAGSHRAYGWQSITEALLEHLAAQHASGQPMVALLWGNDAQKYAAKLDAIPVISSAHPSPLSARRGFFGSRPFSRINAALQQQGAPGIDWRIPPVQPSLLD